MTYREITTVEEWEAVLDSGTPVVVDFHGEAWCVPCRRFAPTFAKTAGEIDEALFVKINVDEADTSIAAPFGIQSVPSVYYIEPNRGAVTQLPTNSPLAFKREVESHVSDSA